MVEPRLLSSCPMMLATRDAVRDDRGPALLLVGLDFSFEALPRVLLALTLAPFPHDVATPASRLCFILMERSSQEFGQRNVSVSRDVSPVG